MLKQRHFVINYLLNNQPEAIDIQTDAESVSDEDAENFIYEVLDTDQPANVTDIRVFQRPVDVTGGSPDVDEYDLLNSAVKHGRE